jgi:predicted exporter
MRDRTKVLIAAAVLSAMAVFCALKMRVSSDVTQFLPGAQDRQLARIGAQLVDSSLTRTMILSVEGPSQPRSIAAAKELAAFLRTDREVAWVNSSPEAGIEEDFFTLFFPHRFALLADNPERDLPARLSDAGLAQSARELKRQLSLPMGALYGRLAGADPLLAFGEELKRLAAARQGPLDLRDGQFVTADGKQAILFLATRSSAFEGSAQAPFLGRLHGAFARLNADGALKLEMSGFNIFAVDVERSVKADISRVSTLSTIAIVLIFLLLFRSPRILLLALLPLGAGMLTATTAGLLVYGRLHGFTLAFGSTLLGVCVDYPILYLNHQVMNPAAGGPWKTLRRLAFPLCLGASTTLAGFVGLAWTSFPGMREIAVFATTGILGALIATCWMLPALAPGQARQQQLHVAVAEAVLRAFEALRRSRVLVALLLAASLAICGAGFSRLRWDDDPARLQRLNPALLSEDERVRAQVSRMDAGRFIITVGTGEETALARNDELYSRLVDARRDGLLQDFRSLHDLIFSAGLQRRNLDGLAASPHLYERAVAALRAEGFRPEAFEPFRTALASRPSPLGLTEVMRSRIGPQAAPFFVRMENEVGILSFVRGVQDPLALSARLEGLPGVRYFDQDAFFASSYGIYRARTQKLIAAGIFFVFAIIFVSCRNLRTTLAAGVPPVLASATTLALLALFGVQPNLLHVVSLLLVLSMGEDYAIFLVASAGSREELRASCISVVLCCLATALGFGLLGLSNIPALQAIGLTTGIGVFMSFLLAPIALAIMPRRSPA